MAFRVNIPPFFICMLIVCLAPAVSAVDDEAINLYNRADQYINTGDYQAALPLLDQALALNTSQFVASGARLYALLDKSKVLIELGNYSGALITIDQALALEETDKLWNNKGYALYKLGRYEEAVAAYDTALRITPDYTIALINNGDALMQLGRYQQALTVYSAALSSPDAVNGLLSMTQRGKTSNNMGDAYLALGRHQEAISAYQSALTNDPGNTEATAGLARARQQADSNSMMVIIASVVVIVIGGAGLYYMIRKKDRAEEKNRSKK